MRLKKGYSQTKNEIPIFCNKMLQTYDLIANTPKHVFDKTRVKSTVYVGRQGKPSSIMLKTT